MILMMLVSLYTLRVILEQLGTDDFGIYNAVGGIVVFLSFLNSALATGSSRFLTFELGIGDRNKDFFISPNCTHRLGINNCFLSRNYRIMVFI